MQTLYRYKYDSAHFCHVLSKHVNTNKRCEVRSWNQRPTVYPYANTLKQTDASLVPESLYRSLISWSSQDTSDHSSHETEDVLISWPLSGSFRHFADAFIQSSVSKAWRDAVDIEGTNLEIGQLNQLSARCPTSSRYKSIHIMLRDV